MTVTIKSWIRTHDYNRAAHHYQRGNWVHRVVYSPEDNEVEVSTLHGNGVPMLVYEYREHVLYQVPDGTADVSALVEELESEDIQNRLLTVKSGYSTEWTGSNYRGSLTENAEDVLESIRERLEFVCQDLPTYCDADDYFMDVSGSHIVPLALDNDRQGTIDTIVSEAISDGYHLDKTDIDMYLDTVLEDYCHQCHQDNDYCTCEDNE